MEPKDAKLGEREESLLVTSQAELFLASCLLEFSAIMGAGITIKSKFIQSEMPADFIKHLFGNAFVKKLAVTVTVKHQ